MTSVVLGVDQGTSSTRCLVFDAELREVGVAAVALRNAFPRPGWVEQDPDELTASVRTAASRALEAAGRSVADVAAVGIANQTETFIVCERESGQAVHPAIVWQDRRTADVCRRLAQRDLGFDRTAGALVRERTGLELDATFPASKIAWVLDASGASDRRGLRSAAEAGELVYADVAGWLLRELCGGIEGCEASNAGRTLLCPLGGTDWDEELLDLFAVPRALMPPIVDSDGVGALIESGSRSAELPVAAVLGDQQASLFGLGCHEPGSAKVTLGTGAFVLAQAGPRAPSPPPGVLASCAWRRRAEARFALEGFVPTAGAAIDWLADVGVVPRGNALDALLLSAGDDDGAVVCVPALQGLGTPSWDAAARGALLGISRATTRADLARAAVDGVLHQVADAVAAVGASVELSEVLLDGGMSRSAWIAQRLADLAGIRVSRSARTEATAAGAAMIAGVAAGVWRDLSELPPVAIDLVCEPSLPGARRAALRSRWAEAVSLSGGWTPAGGGPT